MRITTTGQLRLPASACALLLILVSGCGGGETEPVAEVRYEGTTLLVGAASYPRQASTPAVPEPGTVCASAKAGQREALSTRLKALGLTDHWSSFYGFHGRAFEYFVIHVPDGWEDQWARALRAEPPASNAWVTTASPPPSTARGVLCYAGAGPA